LQGSQNDGHHHGKNNDRYEGRVDQAKSPDPAKPGAVIDTCWGGNGYLHKKGHYSNPLVYLPISLEFHFIWCALRCNKLPYYEKYYHYVENIL
jgi:hypothetical protein